MKLGTLVYINVLYMVRKVSMRREKVTMGPKKSVVGEKSKNLLKARVLGFSAYNKKIITQNPNR